MKLKAPQVVSGSGKISFLSCYLSERKYKKVFLVIDPVVKETEKGLFLMDLLKNFDSKYFDEFTTNPTDLQVNSLVNQLNRFTPEVIIGVGGGSTIDITKAANLSFSTKIKIDNYLSGLSTENVGNLLPMIFVPTTAGTGAEASLLSIIKSTSNNSKKSIECKNFLPELVIFDPEFIKTLPSVIIAATGIDTLSHIIETYISKNSDEKSRSLSKKLSKGFIKNLEKAVFKKDENAFLKILETAFTARIQYSRTGLTIIHAISHPLGSLTNIHHGLAVAFSLRDGLIFNIFCCKRKINNITKYIGFKNIDVFFQWLDCFFSESGIFGEISKSVSLDNKTINKIASEAILSKNASANPKTTSILDLREIINKSLSYWKN